MSVLSDILPDLLRASPTPPWYRNALNRFAQTHENADETERTIRESQHFVSALSRVCEVDVARLAKAQIVVLHSPLTNVQASSHDGEHYIILHEGFLSIVSFAAEAVVLLHACNEMESQLTAKDLVKHGLGRWPSVDTVSGLSSALTYAYFMQPVQLPVLYARDIGIRKASLAAHLTSGAELFAILHEAAHIALGHLSSNPQRCTVRSEFLLPEPSSQEKEQEFEADAYAFAALDRDSRNRMAWGAFVYLRILGTTEFLVQREQDGHHPRAINRLHALLDKFGAEMDEDTRRMAETTIDFLQQDYEAFNQEVVDSESGRTLQPLDKVRLMAFDLPPERASWVLLQIGLFAKAFAKSRAPQL
jgi:hypothetical protein